jgi:hypothetical protein
MGKRRVSAREALADIRSGMADAALMKKYKLLPRGLQSLFDKLIIGGLIDLAEMEQRQNSFCGTAVISESEFSPHESHKPTSPSQADRKSPPEIPARKAAREIKSGVSDFALMQKYRLSSKGLQSLFKKLISAGLITKADLDNRGLGFEDTVEITEDMLSLSGALRILGGVRPASSPRDVNHRPGHTNPAKPDGKA